MSAQQHFYGPTPTITLGAAVETELLTKDGLDAQQSDRAEFLITNTGSTNPLLTRVYYSPLGTNWGLDTSRATQLYVPPGTSVRIPLNPITCTRLRVTATSTAGTTCTIEGILVRVSR